MILAFTIKKSFMGHMTPGNLEWLKLRKEVALLVENQLKSFINYKG